MEIKEDQKKSHKFTSSRNFSNDCYDWQACLTKAVLEQIFGGRVHDIPTIAVTDSKNLEESIKSTSLAEDSWLIPDIAVIKEALEDKTITEVRRVSGDDMIADCLTKHGASGTQLMEVLRVGKLKIPRGL